LTNFDTAPETPQIPTSQQGYSLGPANTPTPKTPEGAGGNGSIDININNQAGDNADIKQSRNMPIGTNVNFKPVFGL